MKKIFSKSIIAIIISAAIFQLPLFAQAKTNFTKEVRPSGALPTGMPDIQVSSERNKVDIKMPKKTRGVIERYKKVNIWGEEIPDSFLFFRNTLNQNQKDVYDVAYKALMKAEKEVDLPVGISSNEFYEVLHALNYDNPEAFWWDGWFSQWVNYDDTVTNFRFDFWLDGSELEQKYEKFWDATSPVLFYASKLPDDMSKIKYIHDYICLSTEYDDDVAGTKNNGGKYQTAYSGSVEYKTICGGYAALFQYYMQQLGIPCAKVRSQTHAWNFLQVNGQYYQMDVTWNDTNQIPPYYNLTNEEMQRIQSHTLWDYEKKFVDSHPSTGKQMSYSEYFGSTPIGSPYTYEELNYYDYKNPSNNNSKLVKIYTINGIEEYAGNPKNINTTSSSFYITLGGGTAEKAKKTAESFSGVTSVSVDNLESGRFNLVVSVNGDSEIRPDLAKKLIGSGFDLYEMSTVQDRNDDLNKNTSFHTSKDDVKKLSPKIGDKGPGGGIIFYIEGNKAYECSEILGKEDWETAKDLCKDYRGGGKSDWYLPDKDQLNYIYMNLRKTGIIKDEKWYWSSSTSYDIYAWYQQFSDGKQDYYYEDSEGSVRAVRSFEY